MLLHSLRNISVQEWRVTWVCIPDMPWLHSTLSDFRFYSYKISDYIHTIFVSFIVVQMGEEYYYAKDYTKALKWVLFTIYFCKHSDSLAAKMRTEICIGGFTTSVFIPTSIKHHLCDFLYFQVMPIGTVLFWVLANLTFI